jgi:Uma2 family endonuclease
MTTSVLEAAAAGRADVLRLTVEQFHGMVEKGIVAEGDAVELIEGVLVRKDRQDAEDGAMVHGHRHKSAVAFLTRLVARVEPLGCWLQVQLPVALSPTSEPEPDAAIVRGRPDDYLDRHAGPEDVLVVIEVAAHSLPYDQGPKLELYAVAGIPTYVIVDLVNDRIEVYDEPRATAYARQAAYGPGQVALLELAERGSLSIPVDELLPPRLAQQ